MIGIIGAMQLETDTICNCMQNKTTHTVAGTPFVSGTLWGREAVVATCGPGKVAAAITAQLMIVRYNPQYILNVGVAGTLCDRLHIGDLAIGLSGVQHDMDTSALGDPVGLVSKINVLHFTCDAALIKAARQAADQVGLPYVAGVIATGDQFVCDKAQKTLIQQRFDAVACEMEGAAIGQACYVNSTPYLIVRAISDEADGGAPQDFTEFAKASAQNTVTLLQAMWPAL